MNWLWCLLCVLFLRDALTLRAKLKSLPVLSGSGKRTHTDYVCFAAPGLAVREETVAAGAEYASSHGLELLDVIPGDVPALESMRMFYALDPIGYRTNRIARGHTTGYCLLVSRELLVRCGVESEAVTESEDLYRLARLFKKYATDKAGLVVAPDLKATSAGNGTKRWPVLSEFMGYHAPMFVLFKGLMLLALLCCVLVSARTGLVVLATYHAQVFLVFAGQNVRPRDLARTTLFRIVLDAWNWCELIVTRFTESRPDPQKIRELRSAYAAELACGIERFFDRRRDDCPVCGGHKLEAWIRTTDLFQAKPGRFRLDRCSACGHVFQNPRLSLAGLDFYYRDFYDGLGAADTERLFQDTGDYRRRAEIVRRLAEPARWLDVGAAYGHFCCYAKSLFPDTEFHGLDMSCAIEEAVHTKWVARGFRGLFPEIAPRLTGEYDVVSLFHYLEHVLDPAQEIRSAHSVLAPGGLMVIEVPNPECLYARAFGKFWMGWSQPQHLNMLSFTNLSRLLRENGFEPVLLEDTHVQRQYDITIAALIFIKWLAPRSGMPWQPSATAFDRLRRLVWVIGFPVLVLACLADLAFTPFVRRFKIASAYSVLARRVDTRDSAVAARLSTESRELQFE